MVRILLSREPCSFSVEGADRMKGLLWLLEKNHYSRKSKKRLKIKDSMQIFSNNDISLDI